MATFSFALAGVGPSAMALRPEVREFRRVELGPRPSSRGARSWGGLERELSRTAGARG